MWKRPRSLHQPTSRKKHCANADVMILTDLHYESSYLTLFMWTAREIK